MSRLAGRWQQRMDERALDSGSTPRGGARCCASSHNPHPQRSGERCGSASRRGHRVSTAHFQAAYPAVAEAGLGSRGVYIGSDLHGGSFVFDPWLLYARGVLGVANTLVLGMPDYGKSSLTKSWLYRSRRIRAPL